MKHILITLLLIISLSTPVWGATYYVNADADAGGDGTTWQTSSGDNTHAWNSVTQVNNKSFAAGDDVYFECGDTWTGAFLNVDWKGVDSDNYSIIGAYEGAGDTTLEGDETLPIIQGAQSGSPLVPSNEN